MNIDLTNVDIATFDQFDAEDREAAALCPRGKNRRLQRMSGVADAIRLALRADYDSDSPVPIIRTGSTPGTAETRTRVGDEPIRNAAVVAYCTACHDPSSTLVPFWINRGTIIVQVDLCGRCARHAVTDLNGEPQVGELDFESLTR